ncbi:MAG: sulfur carrier protein ThiS [Culturomica sp.]|jgi:sulfur carrier protein|nr:sulfur carrier protein ThiS [Culturomica sp.]
MRIILNDKPCEAADGCTLAEFIAGLGLKPQGIAIAINSEVVPKERWATRILTDGEELMLIHAVAGG